MEVIGPATGSAALTNKDIIKRYDGEITKIIKAAHDPTFEFERQILILQARLNWQFVKNEHFTVAGSQVTPFGNTTDYSFFDPGLSNTGDAGGPDIKLAPPINVIGGDLYKYMGVMAANAPRVKGVADDIEDPDSLYAAHVADVNIRDLWWKQQIDRKWKALAFHQYTTGPAYLRAVWNADRKKYGSSSEPKIEIVDGPDGPMPQQIGMQEYANGDAEIHVYSVLDVSHDYEAKEIDQCSRWQCEGMQSKWKLLEKYCGCDGEPGPLDQYREGDLPDDEQNAASSTAAEAKEAVSTPSGTGRAKKPNNWRVSENWCQPYLFEAVTDPEVRAVFKEHFPDGLYVCRVGSVTVEIDNRKTTDEWTICRVGRGEKLLERPIASDVLPLNRAIDDMYGMSIETVLRAITQTFVDNVMIDREAMNTKEAVPAEIILVTQPSTGTLADHVQQIPPARLSDQVGPLIDRFRATMQDISGIRPELSGGGQPTQTFREAKQRKDQALAQLAPQAQAMLDAASAVAELMVKLRAKYGAGTVKANKKTAYGTKTDVVDIASLQDTGWHAEADDQFPMTMADQRDAAFSMLKEFPPEVQQALSILDPLNIGQLTELLQIPGFESAVEEQKEKTLKDINRLLKEEPITGPDGKPQASIPPDSFDNHLLVAQIMKSYLVAHSDIRNDKPANFANLVARYEAEEALNAPPEVPPPPALKGSMAISLKAEDVPSYMDTLLEAAGVNVPAKPAVPAPGPQGPMPSPPPVGGPPQESPIPPPPTGPQGPQPMPVQ